MLVYLSDMSMIGPMSTPDYQASPDVLDWDAMPDPTIDELADVIADAMAELLMLDVLDWDAMPDPTIVAVFGELY